MARPVWVGVDTGGTFTDVVAVEGGQIRIAKVPSTPADPAAAVLRGLAELVPAGVPVLLTYGSTVATNAVLERRGARVVLITTAGFEDVIEIGRQARPDLYALEPVRPEPLVPRADRLPVRERMVFDGSALVPLRPAAVAAVVAAVRKRKPDAVAVCLLHSYANPAHERILARALRRAGFACSSSHEISPLPREFERFSTTVINAYVGPKMSDHIGRLKRGVAGGRVRVMQSNGGEIDARTAGREAVRTILSGPAAGVVGAAAMARAAGYQRIITFDMGGTSTDVSLVDGTPRLDRECSVAGFPISVPAIDVHTVGAGGGSIAFRDAGGGLKVGPESAGADPGPACYGRGDKPTVTDANVVLGRLSGGLLGGSFSLDADRARAAVSRLAGAFNLSVESAAAGIVDIANAAMQRAIRAVSVERGHDPREYVLVAYGGAAGMHACELAQSLRIRTVLVPRDPGVLSAWGCAVADAARDYFVTIRALGPSFDRLQREAARLVRGAKRDLGREGFGPSRIALQLALGVRYAGQSHQLEVPLRADYGRRFHRRHRELYGYDDPARALEVVHVALHAVGRQVRWATRKPPLEKAPLRTVRLRESRRWVTATVVQRGSLRTGQTIAGPAVIAEFSSTTYIPRGWRAEMDRLGHLHVRHAT